VSASNGAFPSSESRWNTWPIRAGLSAAAARIFEWFKEEVWQHTSAQGHASARHLGMGNYSKDQVSEGTLLEIWRFFAVEQGLRVPTNADVSAGVAGAERFW